MKIGGQDYKFKDVTIGEVKRIRRMVDESAALNDIVSALASEELWLQACAEWKALCDAMFEKPDDGLKLENIPRGQLYEIPACFFGMLPEIPTAPGSS